VQEELMEKSRGCDALPKTAINTTTKSKHIVQNTKTTTNEAHKIKLRKMAMQNKKTVQHMKTSAPLKHPEHDTRSNGRIKQFA
jgi:hypothetical protein